MANLVFATKTWPYTPNITSPTSNTNRLALEWIGTQMISNDLGNENRASGCSPTLEIVVRFDNILEWVALINLH